MTSTRSLGVYRDGYPIKYADHRSDLERTVVGQYTGYLDHGVLVPPTSRPEPLEITFITFHAGGTCTIIVDEDGPISAVPGESGEAESASLGIWQVVGKDPVRGVEVIFGANQSRAGARLCGILATRLDNKCQGWNGARVFIDDDGNLTGGLLSRVTEFGDSVMGTTPIPFVQFKKRTMEEYPVPAPGTV